MYLSCQHKHRTSCFELTGYDTTCSVYSFQKRTPLSRVRTSVLWSVISLKNVLPHRFEWYSVCTSPIDIPEGRIDRIHLYALAFGLVVSSIPRPRSRPQLLKPHPSGYQHRPKALARPTVVVLIMGDRCRGLLIWLRAARGCLQGFREIPERGGRPLSMMSSSIRRDPSAVVEIAGDYVDGREKRRTGGASAVGNCRRPGKRSGRRRAPIWALLVSDHHHRHAKRPGHCSRRGAFVECVRWGL